MCGLAFRRIKTIKSMLDTQSSRGLDGIGLIYQKDGQDFIYKACNNKDYKHWDEWKTSHPENKKWFFSDSITYSYAKLEKMYQDIISHALKGEDQESFVFAHHRKGSVGVQALNNTHPFEGKRFHLAQNGTDKRMYEWGIVEGLTPGQTDSYMLLQYIELHCHTIDEAIARMDILKDRKISLGVVVIYCKKSKQFLFYSDGARSLYIKKETPNTIDYIQSREDDTTRDCKTEGYIVVDFEGNIIKEDLRYLNMVKYVPTTAIVQPVADHYEYIDYDDYVLPKRNQYHTTGWTSNHTKKSPIIPSLPIFPETQTKLNLQKEWIHLDSLQKQKDINEAAVNGIVINNNERYLYNIGIDSLMDLLDKVELKATTKLIEKYRTKYTTTMEEIQLAAIRRYITILTTRADSLIETEIKIMETVSKNVLKSKIKNAQLHTEKRSQRIDVLKDYQVSITFYQEQFLT